MTPARIRRNPRILTSAVGEAGFVKVARVKLVDARCISTAGVEMQRSLKTRDRC